MTLDEAIKGMETVAEENQRVVDTHIVFDDVTIDMLYCDDTEVIEEHLANYQWCAEKYRQLAEWLKELKQLREQTEWIPVSERLPNIHNYFQEYLITTKNKLVGTAIFTEMNGRCWWSVDGVIAWMPLPKPYEPLESKV